MNEVFDPSQEVFESKIEAIEEGFERLEAVIERIGMPAASSLKKRVDALRIEEKALKRNLREMNEGTHGADGQLGKFEALLRHIEREESSVEHEAEFLRQGPPSTVVAAAEAGAKVIDALGRGVKRVVGNPVSESMVFVNHSHDTLVERYGLKDDGDQKA